MKRLYKPKSSLLLISILLMVFFFLTPASSYARVAGVENIRHWSNPTYTRIVIDVDKNVKYYSHLLKKDPSINIAHRRLYVDIYGAKLGKRLSKKIPIHDGLLKRVRAGQFKRETVRVVLDIESIDEYKIFALRNPFRIVIDVTGIGFKKEKEHGAPLVPTGAVTAKGADSSHNIRTIIIDAGHGGKDPGAVGKRGLKEKDVTLKLARMLKKRLRKKTRAKVILTRNRDVYIPLEERTARANTARADIFVSIHVNASPRRKASGVETYFLDVSHDRRSIQVAARENSASTSDTGALQYILRDLMRTANRNDSSALATDIQDSLVASLKKRYRSVKSHGVKGAPFYVLVRTNMPSVLVEVSFISNSKEEKRLRSDRYLNSITSGIADGILAFINNRGRGGR